MQNNDDDIMFNITISKPKLSHVRILSSKVKNKKQKYNKKQNNKISKNKNNQFNQQQTLQQNNNGSTSLRKEQKNPQSIRKKIKTNNFSRYTHKNNAKFLSIGKIDQVVPVSLPEKLINYSKSTNQISIDKKPISQMNLQYSIKSSLQQNGVTKLTDIQTESYHPITIGKDVVLKASTGSGKTLAYLIPLLQNFLLKKNIKGRDSGTVMIVICSSRQLCIQANQQCLRCLKRCPFIVPGCLMGGQQINHEKSRLRKGVAILFTTPGRLLYHLQNTKSFKYHNLCTLVFEQADRTLDLGFQNTVNEILVILENNLCLSLIQKILVSAHFNQKVDSLINSLKTNQPVYIGFNQNNNQQTKGQVIQQINISPQLKQYYVLLSQQQRIPFTLSYLRLVCKSKSIVFVNTIDEVQFLDYILSRIVYRDNNGLMTQQNLLPQQIFKIHGNLDQKLRTQTFFSFKQSQNAVLISTEVASRGLDFPEVQYILLFDVPPTITDYGNRVGRSARFNSSGISVLMLHYQQSDYAQKIRYYTPSLEVLSSEVIYDEFSEHLQSMNIGENSLAYLEGLVRSMVKNDDQKYQLARKAYVSMLRAYARMDKKNFKVKQLNLKLIARNFGLNNAQSAKKFSQSTKKSYLQNLRKRRKIDSVRKMQISEYL